LRARTLPRSSYGSKAGQLSARGARPYCYTSSLSDSKNIQVALRQDSKKTVLRISKVQTKRTKPISTRKKSYMINHLETIGYFTAKICDLESYTNTTDPRENIPLSFHFAIDLMGNRHDVISSLNEILDMGCCAVAELRHDLKSDEYSLWTPDSLPEWLHSVLTRCAPGLPHNALNKSADKQN
jgi:hypothetical protein